MRYSLRNEHAIITGGSSGIGKATACLLAREGAHITIVARDPAKLASAKAQIEQARSAPDQQVIAISADVSIQAEAERAVSAAIAQIGPPDILIASAGIVQPGLFHSLPIQWHEKTMAINYFGSLYMIKAVLPTMLARRHGYLALVASGAGLIGVYGYSSYSPTKFALRGLAETLRSELKPDGIRVSVIYPPDTDTPQLAEENKTKPLETKMISGTVRVQSAAGVATAIVRGIRARSFIITPGLEMTVLARFQSLIEPVLEWYVDWIVARVRKSQQKIRSNAHASDIVSP